MKILDCTLRDGAHVNGGRFSTDVIESLNTAFGQAKIDFVEIGFLQYSSDVLATSFYSSVLEIENIVKKYGNKYSKYGFMLRPDRCDINDLKASDELSFLRLAFYGEHFPLLESYIKKSQDLGYAISINPIGVSTLSKDALKRIYEICNKFSVDTFSIVDTHGALKLNTFSNLIDFTLAELNFDVDIGLHFHENLMFSQALLSNALQRKNIKNRLIVDSSVSGMGRIPGNLATEMLIDNFSDNFSDIKDSKKIYEVATTLMEKYYDACPWGYNYLYAKSADLNINRSYPEFFIEKGISAKKTLELLSLISNTEEGDRFNFNFAETMMEENSIDK